MGQIFRYMLYVLFAIMAVLWTMQIFKACNKSKDATEQTATAQDADVDKTATLDIENEEEDGEDLIVYNEEDEGFDEDMEDDEFLDEYEGTDGTLEEDETLEDTKSARANQDFAVASGGDKEVGEENEFTAKGGVSSGGKFMVIAGSFENPANARTLVRQLQQKGYENAESVKFTFSGFHSVCVGRYHDKGDANDMAARLKGNNYPAYVHLRRGKK